MKKVQAERFADFPGTVKSLGAWGGDFFLAASKQKPTSYFKKRRLDKVTEKVFRGFLFLFTSPFYDVTLLFVSAANLSSLKKGHLCLKET